MKKIVLAMIGASALVFAGCETTSSRPYTPSTSNIVAMKDALGASGKTVGIADFTVGAEVDEELTCRAMGALDVGSGKSGVEFIQEALKTEMFQADVYGSSSSNQINGVLTQYEADSWGTGKWELALKLSSDTHPDGYEVATVYEFKSSYSAVRACQNVVDAFTPSVQQLISEAISHPEFSKLAG